MAEKLTMSPMECCEAFHVVPHGFEPIQMSPPCAWQIGLIGVCRSR